MKTREEMVTSLEEIQDRFTKFLVSLYELPQAVNGGTCVYIPGKDKSWQKKFFPRENWLFKDEKGSWPNAIWLQTNGLARGLYRYLSFRLHSGWAHEEGKTEISFFCEVKVSMRHPMTEEEVDFDFQSNSPEEAIYIMASMFIDFCSGVQHMIGQKVESVHDLISNL